MSDTKKITLRDALTAANARIRELEAQLAEANEKRELLCSLLKTEVADRDEGWARIAQLEAALKAVEWVYDADVALKFCPWCCNWQREDHEPDCMRQAALAPEPAATWKPEDGWEAGEDAVRAVREAERGEMEGE